MAITTTTTRTTATTPAPSADRNDSAHAGLSIRDVIEAYFDCVKTKRNTASAREFAVHLEANLVTLFEELVAGTYRPGPSICFIVKRPRPREIWAAQFRDRVVHHLLYNRLGPRFERGFIADSCACIKGRGTLYAARRLESKVRAVSSNWTRRAYYLKCDLANFFVAIDKRVLAARLEPRIPEAWWRELTDLVLFHDPRPDVIVRSPPEDMVLVPPHKRLLEQPVTHGLPIGNLSSQFFANVYLDALDQFVKHTLRARHYIRYVDDFVLLHESPTWLNAARAEIERFLERELRARLNASKTILQPVDRGVDFVGQVIKPWRRVVRPRTLRAAIARLDQVEAEDLPPVANSYFGLIRQASASHSDRARLAKAVLGRGHAVDRNFTRTL